MSDKFEVIKTRYPDLRESPAALAKELGLALSTLRKYASVLGVHRRKPYGQSVKDVMREKKLAYWQRWHAAKDERSNRGA